MGGIPCPPAAPIDLSLKAPKKLRLEDFLRQNLDGAPAPRVIEWVVREEGVFRVLWTHQSSGTFRHDDAALFRYWAITRGKSSDLSSVELKQSLRMALNKSPSVKRLPSQSHSPEYRYFKFTGWNEQSKLRKSPEVKRRVEIDHLPVSDFQNLPIDLRTYSNNFHFPDYTPENMKKHNEYENNCRNSQYYLADHHTLPHKLNYQHVDQSSINCKSCDYIKRSSEQCRISPYDYDAEKEMAQCTPNESSCESSSEDDLNSSNIHDRTCLSTTENKQRAATISSYSQPVYVDRSKYTSSPLSHNESKMETQTSVNYLKHVLPEIPIDYESISTCSSKHNSNWNQFYKASELHHNLLRMNERPNMLDNNAMSNQRVHTTYHHSLAKYSYPSWYVPQYQQISHPKRDAMTSPTEETALKFTYSFGSTGYSGSYDSSIYSNGDQRW